jgi:hypothetical protein
MPARLRYMTFTGIMTVAIPKSNDKTGHWHAAPAAGWEQDSKQRKFPGGSAPARGSPARGRQPGRILEPARLETAGETPQGPASMIRATKPD